MSQFICEFTIASSRGVFRKVSIDMTCIDYVEELHPVKEVDAAGCIVGLLGAEAPYRLVENYHIVKDKWHHANMEPVKEEESK